MLHSRNFAVLQATAICRDGMKSLCWYAVAGGAGKKAAQFDQLFLATEAD
jgi:hypothetical protein